MKVLKISSPKELKAKNREIKDSIINNGAVVIRGLFQQHSMQSALDLLHQELDSKIIIGTTQGTKASVRQNTLKWSVGGSTGSQIGNARFMVTAYNPIFQEDIYQFHNNFKRLIEVRDAIRDDEKNTNDSSLTGDSFNACRFQIYPTGGGFMLEHQDHVGVKNSSEQNGSYLQMLVFLTQRGVHFQKGGAYLVHNEQKIDIEGLTLQGDIVVYDGKSSHGVDDIDPDLPINSTKIRGRVVGLVTIYQ